MQRVVIPIDAVGTNNIGAPTQLTVPGRITAVQFNMRDPDANFAGGSLQVAVSPIFVDPIQQSGLNPQEIARIDFSVINVTTSGSSQYGGIGCTQVLPADYPLTVGEQVFINANVASHYVGSVTLFIA